MNKNTECNLKNESCCLGNANNIECPMNNECSTKDISCTLANNKEIIAEYEMHTDGMTSEIGFARSFITDEDVRNDLQTICEEVLHLNPMLRKPDDAIIAHSYSVLNSLYEKYNKPYKGFFLPLGDSSATSVSRLRYPSRQVIRILTISNNGNTTLKNCFSLLTNLFHLMWMHLSDEKIEFTSKSYN